MNSLASPGRDADSLDPFANLRIGHVYLDVRRRRLQCLNDTARELRREGVVTTVRDMVRQDLRTPAGDPVRSADLPLIIAWQQGRAAEASFVLRPEDRPECYVIWSAAPVRDSRGRLVGVMGSVCASPPAFDWQVLAGLAHDLRTPLQSFAFLLAGLKSPETTDAQREELLQVACSSAERALQVAQDLLQWCRGPAQAGRAVERTWFALGPFLDALVGEQVPSAERKGLKLTARVSSAHGWEVHADRTRLGRLLANLVVNAVRYTASGHVAVTADWEHRLGERALIVGVVDTGTGIAPEERESIFQPFERGRAGKGSDSSSGGSGLGLAVVDRLVRELGLELEVYSEYGQGSAFHLVVPLRILRPESRTGT
jgi:hypothetical protein